MQEIANTKIEMCCGNLFSQLLCPIRVHNACGRMDCLMPDEDAPGDNDNHLDSLDYESDGSSSRRFPRWIGIGAVAAVSALAGGLAAAWFYRKTLVRLHQADEYHDDSDFGIREGRMDGKD